MNLSKILNIVKVVLVSLSVLVLLLFTQDAISLDALIQFSLLLVILLVGSTVIFNGLNIVENPKKGLRLIIGVGALIVFYFIGLGIAEPEVNEKTGEIISGSKEAEAGIYVLYITVVLAILAIVGSSVRRLFA
jgi:hypothetical protein